MDHRRETSGSWAELNAASLTLVFGGADDDGTGGEPLLDAGAGEPMEFGTPPETRVDTPVATGEPNGIEGSWNGEQSDAALPPDGALSEEASPEALASELPREPGDLLEATGAREPVPVPDNPALGRDAWKGLVREDLLRRGADAVPDGAIRDILERGADRADDKLDDKREFQRLLIQQQRETWREIDGQSVLPQLREDFPGHDPDAIQRAYDRAWADEINRQNIPDGRRVQDLDRLYDGARERLRR
ncbi:MAG: hypothetical protein IPG50_34930 [Myxococcales bacterium]|nr:hypothetical protein [Myxococcales bacterium]